MMGKKKNEKRKQKFSSGLDEAARRELPSQVSVCHLLQ